MQKILEIVRRKGLLFLLLSLAYILVIGLLHWWFKPTLESLVYLAGGLIGIYFLDIAEVFFNLSPSPFRSVLFLALFAAVSFFVITSSGSLLASGLVLSLYLSLILWQIGEWQVAGNINSWFRMVAAPVNKNIQQWFMIGSIVLFLLETYFFVR